MMNARYLLAVALLLAACKPAPAPPAAEAPLPGELAEEAYPNCTWGEVTGAGMSIWSYTCPDQRLVADEALPGFQREVTDSAGQVVRTLAIRFFAKAPDAPIDAVLEAVRAASPGAEACVIEPGVEGDFQLLPTGAAWEAYQRFVRGEADGVSQPCGPLGPSEAGGYSLRTLESAPDKVVLINWGTDTPIFDPDTLRPIGK